MKPELVGSKDEREGLTKRWSEDYVASQVFLTSTVGISVFFCHAPDDFAAHDKLKKILKVSATGGNAKNTETTESQTDTDRVQAAIQEFADLDELGKVLADGGLTFEFSVHVEEILDTMDRKKFPACESHFNRMKKYTSRDLKKTLMRSRVQDDAGRPSDFQFLPDAPLRILAATKTLSETQREFMTVPQTLGPKLGELNTVLEEKVGDTSAWADSVWRTAGREAQDLKVTEGAQSESSKDITKSKRFFDPERYSEQQLSRSGPASAKFNPKKSFRDLVVVE